MNPFMLDGTDFLCPEFPSPVSLDLDGYCCTFPSALAAYHAILRPELAEDFRGHTPGTSMASLWGVDDSTFYEETRIAAMERACYEKFAQNEFLRLKLMGTLDMTMGDMPYLKYHHGANDVFWGTGVPVPGVPGGPEIGANELGKILERVRRWLYARYRPQQTVYGCFGGKPLSMVVQFVSPLPYEHREAAVRYLCSYPEETPEGLVYKTCYMPDAKLSCIPAYIVDWPHPVVPNPDYAGPVPTCLDTSKPLFAMAPPDQYGYVAVSNEPSRKGSPVCGYMPAGCFTWESPIPRF